MYFLFCLRTELNRRSFDTASIVGVHSVKSTLWNPPSGDGSYGSIKAFHFRSSHRLIAVVLSGSRNRVIRS